MAVRAKFRVHSKADGVVRLQATYSTDANDPNKTWSDATPWGDLTMGITNEAAASQFEPGQEWFIDLTPAAPPAAS